MIRERGESSKKSVIVVLEGVKASSEETGIAPLWKATRDVINPEDEILVLTLLYVNPSRSSSDAGYCVDHQCNQSCEADPYVHFLRQEISQRKAAYRQIFRPFYDRCKSNGVKFQVKIAAGFRPKDIIIEEANNAKATWIVMDRCFAKDLSFRLSGTDCSVSLVSDDEQAMDLNQLLIDDGSSESSMVFEVRHKPKSPIPQEEPCVCPSLPVFPLHLQSDLASTSTESEYPTMYKPHEKKKNLEMMKPPNKGTVQYDNISPRHFDVNDALRLPLQQLSWEMIVKITGRFAEKICTGQNFLSYLGHFSDRDSMVVVKKFTAGSSRILEAEKRATLSMHHKNILGLIGYHESENATILVFPYARKGSLHKYFCGKGKQLILTFQDKLKIAISIGEAVRYLHEDCPRGPVVHGDLQPSNIFLGRNSQAMICGFGQATWLCLEPPSVSNNRCFLMDPLDQKSMSLVKSDVLSFGVLLLRLFCKKSVPQDDKSLIEWAKPFLLERALHQLLDEESEDVHGIYRVMNAATQCIRSNPISRPLMSEVISILKGQQFCCMQSSPSDSSL